MVQRNYELVAAIAKQGDPLRLVGWPACRSRSLRLAFRAGALLILLVALFAPAKVLAGTVTGGIANPSRAYNAAHTLYVDAIEVAPLLAWDHKQSVVQIIQNAMNAQLTAGGQQGNWPLPVQGSSLNVTFTVNTQANPQNYRALDYNTAPAPFTRNAAGVSLQMTTNMPLGEHWLQLLNTNFLPPAYTSAQTWLDPTNNSYWAIDNGASAGKPFYDTNFAIQPPSFGDGPSNLWDGTSYFHAYLFVADMNANNVITLHDGVYWGFNEPVVVPEPSSLALLAVGVLAVLYYGRRSKFATA